LIDRSNFRPPSKSRRGLLIPLAAMTFVGLPLAPTYADGPTDSYFFNEAGVCTLIVDFSKQKSELDRLGAEQRRASLARTLISSFRQQGGAKCPHVPSVRALAVYIPGVDSYGRPKFGSRVNLLKLEAPAEAFNSTAAEQVVSLAHLNGFKVESY